jgi:hypothetical protein
VSWPIKGTADICGCALKNRPSVSSQSCIAFALWGRCFEGQKTLPVVP